MAFKMNTSIGKIYAKTQGTKPHAKAIAAAKAPKPATGNVGMPTSPFNVGEPKEDTRGFFRKAIDGDQPGLDGSTKQSRAAAAEKADRLKKGTKAYEADQAKKLQKPDDESKVINAPKPEKKLTKKVVKKDGKDPYKKAENKDKDLGSYVKKQKSLKKGTPEWNANQNKINKAYGVKKRYGEGSSTTSTTSTPATESTTTKKVISQKDKDKEKGRQKAIMDRPRVKMGDNKSKDTKAGSDLVGKSRKETRLDRRLAKTQSKGRAIADGKGTKTPAEKRKALRLKRREGRLKKRIENKTKKGPKKGIPITEQGKLNRVEKKSSKKEIPKTTPDFVKYKPTGIKPEGLKLDSAKDFLKKSRTKPS